MSDLPDNTKRREVSRAADSCELVFKHPLCEVDISYRVRRVADPCGNETLPDPCAPTGFSAPSAEDVAATPPAVDARVFVYNESTTEECPAGLQDNPAYTYTVEAAAIESSVRLADLPGATSAQRSVWAAFTQEYLNAATSKTEAELVSYLTLTPAQADVLFALIAAAQEAVDLAADALAGSQVICEAWSDEMFVRCPDTLWPQPALDNWFLFEDGSAVGSLVIGDPTGTTDLVHNSTNLGPAVIPYAGLDSGIIGGRFIPQADGAPSDFEMALLITTQGNPAVEALKPTATGLMVTSLPGTGEASDGTMGHYASLLRDVASSTWKLMYRNATSGAPTIDDLGPLYTPGGIHPPVRIAVTMAAGGVMQFRKQEADDVDWVLMGDPVDVGTSVRYAGLYGFTGDYNVAVAHSFAEITTNPDKVSNIYAPFVTLAEGAAVATSGEGLLTAKQVANRDAKRTAYAQLACHFGNDEVTAHCPAGEDELSAWDPEDAELITTRPDPSRALGAADGYSDRQTVARDAVQLAMDIEAWLVDAEYGDGVTKDAVNESAGEQARLNLAGAGCLYANEELVRTCVNILDELGEYAPASIGGSSFTGDGTTPGVIIRAGAIISDVSGEAADAMAADAAVQEARCFWLSDAGLAGCPDTELDYDADTEAWTATPEEEEGDHVFVAVSGAISYARGAFVSTVSLAAANELRDSTASLDANCLYGNKAIGPRCLSKAQEYSSAIPENHIQRATALTAAVEAQGLSQLPSSVRGNIAGHEDVIPVIEPAPGQTCTHGSRPVLAACVDPTDLSGSYPAGDRHFLSTSNKGLLGNSVVPFPAGAVSEAFTQDSPPADQDSTENELTLLALEQAKASRACQFVNPSLRVHCGASTTVTPDMLDAVEDVAAEVMLPADEAAAYRYHRTSRGSKENPILVPSGAVVSEVSFQDAYRKAVFEAVAMLACFWSSPRIEVTCGQWDSTNLAELGQLDETYPAGRADRAAYDSDAHIVKASTGAETGPPSRTAVVTQWADGLTDADYEAKQDSFKGVGALQDVFAEPKNLNVDVLPDGTERPRVFLLEAGAIIVDEGQVESYDEVVRQAVLQAKSQAPCRYTHTSATWFCGANPINLSPTGPRRLLPPDQVSISTDAVLAGTYVSTISQLEAQKDANRDLQQRWESTFNNSKYGCSGAVKLVVKGANLACETEKKGIGTDPVTIPIGCQPPGTLAAANDDTMAGVRIANFTQRTSDRTSVQENIERQRNPNGDAAHRQRTPATPPAITKMKVKQAGVYVLHVSATVDYDLAEVEKSVPGTTVRLSLKMGGSPVAGANFDGPLASVVNYAGFLVGTSIGGAIDGSQETFEVTGCADGTPAGGSVVSSAAPVCGSVDIPKIPKYKQTPSAPHSISGTWMLTVEETSAGAFIRNGNAGKLKAEIELTAQVLRVQDKPSVFPFSQNWMALTEVKVKVTQVKMTLQPLPLS